MTAVGNGHDEMVESDDAVEASIAAEDKLIGVLSQGVDEALDALLVPSASESLWNDDDADIDAEFVFGF